MDPRGARPRYSDILPRTSRTEPQENDDELSDVCYPHNWQLEGVVKDLRRLQDTVQAWDPGRDNLRQKWSRLVLLAYLDIQLQPNDVASFNNCKTKLEEVLKENPTNISALGTLAFLYKLVGMHHDYRRTVGAINEYRKDTGLQDEALYNKAFAYLHAGPAGSDMASHILHRLHITYPEDFQILLDLILCMTRRIDMKRCGNKPFRRPHLNALGRYIKEAHSKNSDHSLLVALMLHLDVAARTSPLGKGWMKKFTKEQNLPRLNSSITSALKNLFHDGRDLQLYTSIIRYYDRHHRYTESFRIAEKALEDFPQDKLLRSRIALRHLELAKRDLKLESKINREELMEAISRYQDLLDSQVWWYRYKMAVKLGNAYYMLGDVLNGLKYYERALLLFQEESGHSLQLFFIHINWCYTLCLCHKAHNAPFSHMKEALGLECLRTFMKDIPFAEAFLLIFEKAYEANPDDVFYILSKAYLDLITGKQVHAERLFRHAVHKEPSYDTIVGMVEYYRHCNNEDQTSYWYQKLQHLPARPDDVLVNRQIEALSRTGERRARAVHIHQSGADAVLPRDYHEPLQRQLSPPQQHIRHPQGQQHRPQQFQRPQLPGASFSTTRGRGRGRARELPQTSRDTGTSDEAHAIGGLATRDTRPRTPVMESQPSDAQQRDAGHWQGAASESLLSGLMLGACHISEPHEETERPATVDNVAMLEWKQREKQYIRLLEKTGWMNLLDKLQHEHQ